MPSKKYKILLMLALVTLPFGIVNALQQTPVAGKQKSKPVTGGSSDAAGISYDKVLMAKLQRLSTVYGKIGKNVQMQGVITLEDGANPAAQMNHVPFVYHVRGNDMYYRMGGTETINNSEAYVYIDHVNKQVVIGAPKQLRYSMPVPSLNDLISSLQEAHYELSGSLDGTEQTITLLNENNINCKQYTIVYDTRKLTIKRMFARFANMQSPENKLKERKMNVELTQWVSSLQKTGSYNGAQDAVFKKNGVWHLKEKYTNYHLILI